MIFSKHAQLLLADPGPAGLNNLNLSATLRPESRCPHANLYANLEPSVRICQPCSY